MGDGLGDTVNALIVHDSSLYATASTWVWRWSDGTWQAIGTSFNNTASTLAFYDGQLVAGGSFTRIGGVQVNRVARWTGTAWQGLDAGLNGPVASMVIYNGRLIVGGNFTVAGDDQAGNIAAWDGAAWEPLGTGFSANTGASRVAALALYGGALYAGGRFSAADGQPAANIARWDGQSWQPLGAGVNGEVTHMVVYDGELVVSGAFTSAGDTPAIALARWNGSAWLPMPGGAGINPLAVFGGSLIVSGGSFVPLGVPAFGIAAWNGTAWHAVSDAVGGLGDAARAVTIHDGGLIVGGDFENAGNRFVNRIARRDGDSWVDLAGGVNGSVFCLASIGGRLYAGGSFSAAGGQPAANIACWDGSAWSPLGAGPGFPVRAILEHEGRLVVGGFLGNSGARVARWDGASWQTIGSFGPFGASATGLALAVYNDEIVAAGEFQGSIRRWTGSAWLPLGSGVSAHPRALLVHDGELYVGGSFTSAGDVPARGIARWDGATWHPVGDGVIPGFGSYEVRALIRHRGEVIAGGRNLQASGQGAPFGVVRWNGAQWAPIGLAFNDEVNAFAVDDGRLLVAGAFLTTNGQCAAYLGTWSAPLTPVILSHPRPLITCPQGSATLSVVAQGTNLTYQWRRNGVPLTDGETLWASVISGASTPLLRVDNANLADTGPYDCVVTSSEGCAIAGPAGLRVCRTDQDCNGRIEPADVARFVARWHESVQSGTLVGDFDVNGVVNAADVSAFLQQWLNGIGTANAC